eukprot:TRINITY_DN3754_c0_g1_i1.p1 TRINITY_DN3754_c0_g1~~TRINITY_DN3754_c0_g1_i1.p1  ORF type:complete len:973 (-),score=199.97 TRINITY_DN3754_c0_g1_i1:23-2626(-)
MKETVKKLVARKQLEFINGGWCMHDEAATHYVAMIDQTTLGHRLLKSEFGAVPTIGWQIDPFGHSSTQAALLSARVGFDGLFFARIDYQDSAQRNQDKTYEMIWRPSPSLGKAGQVFTGAFERNGYGPPKGFNWDSKSDDAPIQDDPDLTDYNVDSRVEDFVQASLDQFSANRGNDIMFTLGSDFQYSNAYTWYKNLDKLIDYVNKDGRINIFYSTPSEYVAAKQASNISWTVKTDDFFPYADCPNCYWTGYFTSRPALKRNVRVQSGYLNAARQMESLTGGDGTGTAKLQEAVALAQHHDAVSGTSKQHVAYDYAQRMGAGRASAENTVNQAFSTFVGGDKPSFTQCASLNETFCELTQNSNYFAVVAYNPLGRTRTELIKLPIAHPNYEVYDINGNTVVSQIEKSWVAFPKQFKPAPYVLYFEATTPALGHNTYFVKSSASASKTDTFRSSEDVSSFENDVIRVDFDSNGGITHITNKKSGISTPVTQQFMYYTGVQKTEQNSGAYIFRPNEENPIRACTSKPTLSVVQGPVVSELRTVCGWLAQVVRLTSESFLEVEYQTSEVPIADDIGKEVITRFSTGVQSSSYLYTDSNGREFLQRKRNYRPTWNLTVTQPVAGNYYPVNVGAFINDTKQQFTVLTDRSQGGASIHDGELEIMIHRRLLYDDSRGVREPLNETDGISPYPGPVRRGTGLHITGSHFIHYDTPSNSFALLRGLQSRIFSPLVLGFTNVKTSIQEWVSSHTATQSPLANELPLNIDLMTLEAVGGNEYILRLSHQFGVKEDSKYSFPVTIDLNKLFNHFPLSDLKEVSLTTNQDAGSMKRLEWMTNDEESNKDLFKIIPFTGSSVTINPADIRTFTFKVSATQ